MITNHAQFIDAIRDRKLVRIVFYSLPDAGTVDRECAPLDYGVGPDGENTANRYWIWDEVRSAGTNPLGLMPDQIVQVQVLGKDFDPGALGLEPRAWHVPREWGIAPAEMPPAVPQVPKPGIT